MGSCFGKDESAEGEKTGLVDKSPTGEPRKFEREFKGPIKDRSCTDVICCLIFVFCISLLLLCAVIAYARGDPERIVYPTNSDGLICGKDITDRTKLVYFDFMVCARLGPAVLQLGCPTPQVCVHKCPTEWWAWLPAHSREQLTGKLSASDRDKMICLQGRNAMHTEYVNTSIKALVDTGKCAPFTFPSVDLLGRCLPQLLQEIGGHLVSSMDATPDNVTAGNNQTVDKQELKSGTEFMAHFVKIYGVLQSMFEDVVTAWPYLLCGFILSMLLCLLWVLLLRYTAKIMVLVSIVGFVLIFAFLTAYSAYRYAELSRKSNDLQQKLKLTSDIGYYGQLSTTWLIVLIISAVTLLIVVVLLIWLRERISIAIAIIAETSKCIAHMISTLLFPIVPFVLQLAVLVFFIVTALHMASMGKPEMRRAPNQTEMQDVNLTGYDQQQVKGKIDSLLNEFTPCDSEAAGHVGSACRFVKYGDDNFVKFSTYMQVYNLFMFFWLFNFIDALCQMTLAGAFASYYFAFDKSKDVPAFPLLMSFWRCIRYHLGSIAFGSLIVAIIQLIRVLLEYVDQKLKAAQNPIATFFIKCLKCCFWCLEKFIKFLNKNAYIMVAIYGRNFCLSAKDAFFLILRNIVRVAVIDQITDFVLFISKLVVVGLIGTLAFFFFDGTLGRRSEFISDLTPADMNYYFVPVIIIIVFAYCCACLFFSVYSMGVDTIFLCFLEDLERNDGSAEKPYFMPHDLMDILGKKNDPAVHKLTDTDRASAAAANRAADDDADDGL